MNQVFKRALQHFRWTVIVYVGVCIPQYVVWTLSTVYYQRLIDQIVLVRSFFDLRNIFLIYALLGIIKYTFGYLLEYPYRILDNGIYQWAKVYALNKIARIDYRAYQGLGTGKLVQLVENGAQATKNILHGFYLFLLRDLIPQTVSSLLLIGIYDRTVMVFVLVSYVVVFFIAYLLLRYLREKKEKILVHEEDFSRFSVRGFMELVVFRLNKRFRREIERVESLSDTIVKSKAQMRMVHELFFVLYAYIMFFIQLGVIYYQIGQIAAGLSTIGTLVALVAFVDQVYQPIAILNVLFVDYKLNLVTFKRFERFLSLPDDANLSQRQAVAMGSGEIVFDRVGFSYEEQTILHDLSLRFEGGRSTALVGTTGSGKSTIAKLVLALLKPDEGTIYVDGQDVAQISLNSYYEHVAYISQDAPVFDGTLRENLLFDRRATDEEIWSVLEKVQLKEFVTRLPTGLDTEIGERGIKLSGGEKQRLAFGRMFFQNPHILVLDEPTSALDSTTEAFITENMLDLFRGKTLIVIAHRLQTVKNVDRILVIEEGQVVQDGAFEELIDTAGRFQELWVEQTR